MRISGFLYVTSNSFVIEISDVLTLLKEMQSSDDIEMSFMVTKAKYDKYWGDQENINLLIFIATLLDPPHKFGFVEFAIKKMYEEFGGHNLFLLVKDAIYNMFKEYERLNLPQTTASSSSQPSMRQSNVTMDVEHKNRKRDLLKK